MALENVSLSGKEAAGYIIPLGPFNLVFVVTDIGMVGPADSVIGDNIDSVLDRFLTMMPHRLSVGKGKVTFNSVVAEVDDRSGQALSINRLDLEYDPSEG